MDSAVARQVREGKIEPRFSSTIVTAPMAAKLLASLVDKVSECRRCMSHRRPASPASVRVCVVSVCACACMRARGRVCACMGACVCA